jgi:tetratricopeptide (TPR) repeat protein
MKYLWLADRTFKQGEWEEAGTFYAKALGRLRGGQYHAGLLFMQGYCQHKAGDAAGKTQMKIAESLLAGADHRTSLPIFLQERGLLAAARRQLEILVAIPNMQRFEEVNYCRTVLSSILMNNSVQHGKPKSVADCERAAALTQAYLLSQIMMHPEPLTLVQYQRLNTYIHEARGWSHLLSKRPEAAAHEAGKVLGLMFQAADFSECVVEALDKTGKKKLADDLTDLAFKPLDRICSTYPESAHYHNGRAWIGARHNRYLDKALTSARKAVALAPETSAYVDTLGEVLFRNGLVKEAIAACEKSILLEPHEPFFKKQYHRFSGKPYRAKSKD